MAGEGSDFTSKYLIPAGVSLVVSLTAQVVSHFLRAGREKKVNLSNEICGQLDRYSTSVAEIGKLLDANLRAQGSPPPSGAEINRLIKNLTVSIEGLKGALPMRDFKTIRAAMQEWWHTSTSAPYPVAPGAPGVQADSPELARRHAAQATFVQRLADLKMSLKAERIKVVIQPKR